MIRTPSRKKSIKQLSRKSYHGLATSLTNTGGWSKTLITKIASKIKAEMRILSSDDSDSILRDTVEAVKNFSWETIRLELNQHTPTLMSLLSLIVNKPSDRVPLMCFIASLIIKCQHQCLCLVQRAVSVMLYGNGCTKQVLT